MNILNPNKVGLVFGLVIGGFHVIWTLLVAFGWGQGLMDFILWAHMVTIDHTVGPFDFMTALVLIVVTAIIGYIVGYIFGSMWNWLHR